MQHWTDYWQSTNALNSFAEGEQGTGYQAEISQFWNSQFASIQPKSTVVDLGTGNGAIAVLAQQYSEQNTSDWNVIGLDAADINPNNIKVSDKTTQRHLHKIQFVGKTPIEKAPFDKETVDAFISQFAFEYSDLEASLKQSLNSLKPHGFISLICHHPDSHISKDSLVGEKVLETFLESPAFMQTDLLLDIANQQGQARQMQHWGNNPYRQKITATLHWVFKILTTQFNNNQQQQFWCSSSIEHLTKILQQIGQVPASHLRNHLQNTYKNLDSHRQRLKDQNNACLTEDKEKLIEKICSDYSAQFSRAEVTIEDKLFGIHILIKK